MVQIVPFGPWLPDQAPLDSGGASEALNVIPALKGYRPHKTAEPFSGAMAARCLSAVGTVDSAGNYRNYAGAGTKLYELTSATTWTERTRASGGDYTTAAEDRWDWLQWGNSLIGVNGLNDDPQDITLGGSAFAALSGSPPRARCIAAVREHVVLGNTYTAADGNTPQRVVWSGIGNKAAWTPSLETLADYQDLVGEGGWVQRIIGGEYGVIFRERCVVRMNFVGPPAVFQFDEVEGAVGTPAPWSAVRARRFVFYLGEDGFYVFDGVQSLPIGDEKIDEYFLADFDPEYPHEVVGAVDLVKGLVYWSYPGQGNIAGIPNRLLVFNTATQQWSRVEVSAEWIGSLYSSFNVNMDTMDGIFPSLDAMTGSLDDRALVSGALGLGLFDSAHRLNFFTGQNMEATVDTAEFQPFAPRRSFLGSLRPIVDGGTLGVKLGTRDLQTGSVAYGAESAVNATTGEAHFRQSGRYMRARLRIAAGSSWALASGIEVTRARAEGRR